MLLRRRSPLLALVGLLVAAASTGCVAASADGRRWVRHVRLQGVRSVKKNDVASRITLAESSWIPLTRRRWLEPLVVPLDQERIEAYYRAHGYFSARVTSAAIAPGPRGSADVHFTVDEGPPSRVTDVTLWGLDALPAAEQREVVRSLPLRRGRPFVHEDYLQTKRLVERRLQRRGHAWVAVSGSALVDRDRHTVVVILDVTPGPRVRLGRVDALGSGDLSPRVLARRTSIREGAPYDPVEIERSRVRLQAQGLFSVVEVEVAPRPGQLEIADVVVRVSLAERVRNELRLGVGIGIEPQRQEVHLGVRYLRRSFLGGLRTLRIDVLPAYVVVPTIVNARRHGPALHSEVAFSQPDFLRRDLTFDATLGYDVGVDYAFQYHGPSTSAGLHQTFWRERIIVGASYHFQYLDFFNTDPTILLSDPAQAKSFFGYTDPYRLGYLVHDVALDLRDRPLHPHLGAYLLLSAEVGAPALGGAFSYQRLIPDGRVYLPLGKRATLAMRLEYGHVFHGDKTSSPITRRLYAGGPDSHRGFGYNRLSPQVPSGSPSPPIPVGGDQLLLGQIELRVDVLRLFGNWLGVVAFFDIGDVPAAGQPLALGQLHRAAGGGLRYRTLIGTIRADLGVRLNRLGAMEPDGRFNPDPGSRVAFHLSIGEAF